MTESKLSRLQENFNFLLTIKNPLTYIREGLGLIKDKFIVYSLRSGQKFQVRANSCDRGIIKEIFFHHCYNPEGFAIGANDIVVDIGAQIGVFSVYAAQSAAQGKVHSFEPFGESFELLQKNITLNNCHNINAYNLAVAAEEGRRVLFLAPGNTGGHSLEQMRPENNIKLEVTAISLANFMDREKIAQIDFLKIDCEGGEYEIFFNLPEEKLQKIKKISMEYHNLDQARNGEKMKEFLAAHGFTVRMELGKFRMIYASR
jgi:FkbM family methyltransferase